MANSCLECDKPLQDKTLVIHELCHKKLMKKIFQEQKILGLTRTK